MFSPCHSFASSETALHFGPEQLIAVAVVVVFSVFNFFGIRRIALLQNTMTVLKIALLLMFIVGGLWAGRGDWHHFSQPAARWTTNSVWQQFAVTLFWIYVAYSGWNAATYVGEEMEDPERTLGRALALGTAIVTALYFALNVLFIYAVPLESMKGVVAIGGLAASNLFGSKIAGLFSALMACALLSTVNAMIIAGPRVYYAMARDGQFISHAAVVHPRWRTPVNSIIIQGICTILLVFTPFPQLVIYIGFTLSLFTAMSVASLLWFRRRPGWKCLRVVSFGYPLIPCLFLVVAVWMIIEGMMQRPVISALTALTLATGGLIHSHRAKPQTRLGMQGGSIPG